MPSGRQSHQRVDPGGEEPGQRTWTVEPDYQEAEQGPHWRGDGPRHDDPQEELLGPGLAPEGRQLEREHEDLPDDGRHMQISTWVSSQKLRLISAAVRVNMQFLCCWRLRNQHELDAVIEELSALLPKEQLYRLYEQATREPYSFLFVYYLKPRNEMFYKRFEERFALEKDADGSGAQLPGPEAVRQLHADQR